ncbi:helix-turn-helix domain-containing protein [Actinomadura graeca]|uniref:Helix-turn-helix domain-containing protein n=1 Tax=Actinomadura graeca TaxID=2750812 RepID=A0ABX8R330_9ACTN|nr:helix-turn-helix domain-containing protein [Actinomadura graeca]QXJ25457.1 helix-turn-helix domain-containing protein [Actinomadura graeca]
MQGYVNPTGYRELPAPRRSGLVCSWTAALPPDAAPFVQRVLPDGCVDLIWSDAGILLAGPDTGPMPAAMRPGDAVVAVRFAPGLAPPVLGVPADAVRDGRLPLREVWGADADRLAAEVAAAVPDARPGVLVAGVTARAARAAPSDPLVPAVVSGLARSSVRAVSDALGLGERQLRRRSLAAFGYGPKTLQRVLRFQRALRLARAGRPLADVALAAGYADQAHLAHEVRDLAGEPIRGLL